jgi:hypothetical protein
VLGVPSEAPKPWTRGLPFAQLTNDSGRYLFEYTPRDDNHGLPSTFTAKTPTEQRCYSLKRDAK